MIALDEKYGQGLWTDFPEIANKGIRISVNISVLRSVSIYQC